MRGNLPGRGTSLRDRDTWGAGQGSPPFGGGFLQWPPPTTKGGGSDVIPSHQGTCRGGSHIPPAQAAHGLLQKAPDPFYRGPQTLGRQTALASFPVPPLSTATSLGLFPHLEKSHT